MIKISDNQFLLNFSAYTETPQFIPNKRKDYVEYGPKNDYPQYLDKLFYESANHGSVVRSKVDFICGQGWKVNTQITTTEQQVLLQKRIGKVNSFYESLDDLTKYLVNDWKRYGWFAIQIIETLSGEKYFYHIPVWKLRYHKDGQSIAYCDDWSARKPEEHESFQIFPFYSKHKKQENSIYIHKDMCEGNFYPYPEYQAAINWIDADRNIGRFTSNSIENGFHGGYLINFVNGVPSVDEMEDIELRVKEKLSGPDGERIMINFSDGSDRKAEVVPLTPPDLHSVFIALRDTVQSQIFTAHRVDPVLMGVKTEGQLGGRTEVIEKTEWLTNTYVRPNQKVLEDVFNFLYGTNALYIQVLQAIGLEAPRPAETETVDLATMLGTISPLVATKVLEKMTDDEIRSIIGLGALKPGAIIRQTEKKVEKYKECCSSDHTFSIPEDMGVPVEMVEVLFAEEVKIIDEEGQFRADINEDRVRQNFAEFTDLQKSILAIYKDNPDILLGEVADALNKELKVVENAVKQMQERGAVEITEDGRVKIKREKTIERELEEEITVMYRYVKRSDAPPLKTESRDFCKTMESFTRSRLLTRDEIDRLNNQTNDPKVRDVWTHRGGWYTNPTTKRSVPFCRHIWESVVVRIKK